MICRREAIGSGDWVCQRCGSMWSASWGDWLPLRCPDRQNHRPQPSPPDERVMAAVARFNADKSTKL